MRLKAQDYIYIREEEKRKIALVSFEPTCRHVVCAMKSNQPTTTSPDSRSERNAKGIVSEREEEVRLNLSEDCTGQCSATTSRFHRNFVLAPMAIPRSV